MINRSIELEATFRLALEALELDSFYGTKKQEAITAIKEALSTKCVEQPAVAEQHKQEPVAHMNQHGVIHEAGYPWGPTNRLEPLYTTPYVATNWGAVHDKLMDVWHRELSADEGLDEIQDLIDITPPQRTWVGLTDEERWDCLEASRRNADCRDALVKAVEAKLKAKNERKEKNTSNGGCV